MGGDALIEALRRIDTSVKVLAMSGSTAEAAVRGTTGMASVPFLHKPHTAEQLLKESREAAALVTSACHMPPSGGETILIAG